MKIGKNEKITKGKLRFRVGVSFFALTFVMLIMRQSYLFAMYFIALTLHETAHAAAARIKGFKTNEIVLSAFGAVLYGEFEGITPAEELFVVLAGPFCNVCLLALTAAAWWFFPPAYFFTEDFFYCNVAICLINLLPAYPLDGGRALLALLNKRFAVKKSERILQAAGITVSFFTFALFLYTCFNEINLTFGLFSVFLFANATALIKKNAWDRAAVVIDFKKHLGRGMEVKRFAVSHKVQLRQLVKLKSKKYLTEIVVIDSKHGEAVVISFCELDEMFIKCDLEMTVGQAMSRKPHTELSRRN